VISGRWSVVGGQWSVVSGRCLVVSYVCIDTLLEKSVEIGRMLNGLITNRETAS
jgi:hypothetical protein